MHTKHNPFHYRSVSKLDEMSTYQSIVESYPTKGQHKEGNHGKKWSLLLRCREHFHYGYANHTWVGISGCKKLLPLLNKVSEDIMPHIVKKRVHRDISLHIL